MDPLDNLDFSGEFFDENGNLLDQETLNTFLSENENRSEEPKPPNQQPTGNIYLGYTAKQQRRLQEVYQNNNNLSANQPKALNQELGLDPPMDFGEDFFDENGNLLDQETLNTFLSENESRSEEPKPPNQQPTGNIYLGYTAKQQRRLQEVYQNNNNPSANQPKALNQELGLDPPMDFGEDFIDQNGNVLDQEILNTILSEDENRSQEPEPPKPKGKTYVGYSAEQERRLQEVYQKNTHPSEKQRKTLSRELRLDPSRIKFWFQNRRSLGKKRQEKVSGWILKAENQKLQAENDKMKQFLASAYCPNCGVYSCTERAARNELLRAKNNLIREKIQRITRIVDSHCGIGTVANALLQASTAATTAAANDDTAANATASTFNNTTAHVGDSEYF